MVETSFARHWFMHTSHTVVGLSAAARISPEPQASRWCCRRRPARSASVWFAGRKQRGISPLHIWPSIFRKPGGRHKSAGLPAIIEVCHAWEWLELGIDDPTDYDCLVLLGWPSASNRTTQADRASLPRRRDAGRCTGHACRGARLVRFRRRSARRTAARRPPLCLLEVQRSQTAWHHPLVEGVETMIAEGEVYSGPRFSPETTVLLTAHNGQREQPVAWAGATERGGRSAPRSAWTTTSASRVSFACLPTRSSGQGSSAGRDRRINDLGMPWQGIVPGCLFFVNVPREPTLVLRVGGSCLSDRFSYRVAHEKFLPGDTGAFSAARGPPLSLSLLPSQRPRVSVSPHLAIPFSASPCPPVSPGRRQEGIARPPGAKGLTAAGSRLPTNSAAYGGGICEFAGNCEFAAAAWHSHEMPSRKGYEP